uniref:Uncharacterized protein n=1 Tax=Bicosoecida sp. CB-2014 TaxID=1486930 RepID=A0A7S1C4J5_9STRA
MAEEASTRRRLRALAYPRWREFRLDDDNEVVLLVAFLEDRKVRALPMEARAPLRTAGPGWHDAFLSYVGGDPLNCPLLSAAAIEAAGGEVDRATLGACVMWLIGHAIGVEYEDVAEAANAAAVRVASDSGSAPASGASGGGEEGADAAAVRAALTPIAALLGVRVDGRAPAELTEAVRRAVQRKVVPAVEAAGGAGRTLPLTMDGISGGLLTGDAALDRAIAVARLLYVSDLRQLQDSVNELLVSVQAYTADPKTDSRLGKVGR